jgi:hypothetical protein
MAKTNTEKITKEIM